MKNIYTYGCLLALFMSSACTDKFEEYNTRPNLVTEGLVNVNHMLTLVQVRSIVTRAPYGGGTIGNYSGMSYSGANRPFIIQAYDDDWNYGYTEFTNNLSDIIRLTKDDPELVNKKAIARIMKVWAFSNITDTYGDIPYFQSGLPIEEAVYDPAYDPQEKIYEDFFKELKEAAAELDASKESYGNADLVYKGNTDKWKKLANSLRLRLALRVRYANEAMAKAAMSDLSESDLITGRGDDAYIFTSASNTDNENPWYTGVLNQGTNHNTSTMPHTLISNMVIRNDPRVKIWADTAMATFPGTNPDIDWFGYRGTPLLGLVPVENKYPYGDESTSRRSYLWYVQVIERPVMRSSEVYFALAEAALFNLKSGDAQALYQKGVQEAMNWAQEFYALCKPQLPKVLLTRYPDWTQSDLDLYFSHKELTQAEVDAFMASPALVLSGTEEEKLENIIIQKNLAMFPMESQNWAEWRRTGYPKVLVGPDNDHLKGVSPRRMLYPAVEQTINSVSWASAAGRMDQGDHMLSKVWWDANPNVPYTAPGAVEWRATPWN
ncbi:MAG: SusD/RagB family nutrient-binding outer membrane lipoprotein [Cyclobacteriaceae bacterium]|nr:SusD/RagB family nutrient-binding outer membrane lipoprotein [Cyclobacteriaceae bacterium]